MTPELTNKVAWLAGFLDGEGCFLVYKRKSNHLYPQITVNNTHIASMLVVSDLFEQLGIVVGAHIREETLTRKREIMRIALTGNKNIAKFLEIVLPFLVTKRVQAVLLLEFLTSRVPRTPLTNRQWELYYEIRYLNTGKTKGKPLTTSSEYVPKDGMKEVITF